MQSYVVEDGQVLVNKLVDLSDTKYGFAVLCKKEPLLTFERVSELVKTLNILQ